MIIMFTAMTLVKVITYIHVAFFRIKKAPHVAVKTLSSSYFTDEETERSWWLAQGHRRSRDLTEGSLTPKGVPSASQVAGSQSVWPVDVISRKNPTCAPFQAGEMELVGNHSRTDGPHLQRFDLQFFDFTTMWRQHDFHGNCTLSLEL